MNIADAIELVLDLARQSALEPHHITITPELSGEYERQQEALKLVEDFVVNHLLNEAAPELVELLDNTAASLHTMLIHFGNQLPPEDQRAKRVVLKAAQDAVKKLRVGS